MYTLSLSFSLLTLLLTCWTYLASAWEIGEQVRTTSGTIQGQASLWQPEISEYLGIRFAQAPVSQLRFAYPRPFTSNGVIQAKTYSPDCPANAGIAAGKVYRE
jgi:carboxylesterase type B